MIGYIFIAVAVLLFAIGFFIKVKKITWLISGYNTSSKEEKEKYDIDKLCYYMGNFVYILAIIWLLMGLFTIMFSEHVELITGLGIGLESVVIVAGIIYLNTNNRVKK